LYQLACFWLQIIENYDSAGVKNEEISNFSCHEVQRQVTTGVVEVAGRDIKEVHPFHLSAPHPLRQDPSD